MLFVSLPAASGRAAAGVRSVGVAAAAAAVLPACRHPAACLYWSSAAAAASAAAAISASLGGTTACSRATPSRERVPENAARPAGRGGAGPCSLQACVPGSCSIHRRWQRLRGHRSSQSAAPLQAGLTWRMAPSSSCVCSGFWCPACMACGWRGRRAARGMGGLAGKTTLKRWAAPAWRPHLAVQIVEHERHRHKQVGLQMGGTGRGSSVGAAAVTGQAPISMRRAMPAGHGAPCLLRLQVLFQAPQRGIDSLAPRQSR